ncbi:MAG: NAD(FAD)-utilizing dehydrogenase, sll0175 homolog [uncultured Caballeronia sp.]|nr:MAG: NAD(FAD)-utilizing dehydrogenase, sll0175 homolog [uncultured Caballeronia sp.]
MHDAVLTGVETRTSSPLRVRRKNDYQSVNVEGLYPAGEGRTMRAASIRRRSTVSKWPRRWRCT